VPEDELTWRIHFLIGAMAHSMFGPPDGHSPTTTLEHLLKRLVTFVAAGMRAPLPGLEEK
jgi:hypothetical protein